MTTLHPALSASHKYPDDRRHALLLAVQEAAGTGITLSELLQTNWFTTYTDAHQLIELYTTYELVDTIETGVPGEKRILLIPGERLLTASPTDIQFAVNTLFDT